nr:cytochrome c family protein [Sagittula stellata]
MTVTKVVGGVCGALLVYLMSKWGAETLYHVGGGGHGEEHASAYLIEAGSSEPAEAEPEVPFEELLASADVGDGEKVFGKCRACHKIDGSNATGPHLDGVVGRPIGSVGGFNYSGNLNQVGDAWTPEHLNTFLESPKAAAPGTTMSFNGLSKPEDRAAVIAFLQSVSG